MARRLMIAGGKMIFEELGGMVNAPVGGTTTTTTTGTTTGPSTCLDGDPEMVLTLSDPDYAGGDITWCGETWTQSQIQAADSRTVCPTSYRNAIINSLGPGASTITPFPTAWGTGGGIGRNSWQYGNELELQRTYALFRNTSGTAPTYFIYGPIWRNRILFNGNYAYDYFMGTGQYIPRPIGLYGNSPYGDAQILAMLDGVPPRMAPYGTYQIGDNMFSSYVSGGVTYTWARGNGW